MNERRALFTSLVLMLVALSMSCGQTRVGPPLTPPLALSSVGEQRGEVLFMRHCHQCHPGGAGGLAPSINDKPIPRELVRAQIRLGIGAMPAFSEKVLADDEVDAITAYVAALRQQALAEVGR
jgi:mono/diheme cytochrome c family protein